MKTEELKVLDFVRTKDGEIGQVISISGTGIYTDSGIYQRKDIIDFDEVLNNLVQDGDYINGIRVYKRQESGTLSINGHSIYSTTILQLMTKEKFYHDCYSPNSNEVVEWRVIEDFPLYQVSSLGIIKSTRTGKYMSYIGDKRTLSVRLETHDGVRFRRSVAVLVLEAFKGKASHSIPHFKDGDHENCRLDNLEWEYTEEDKNKRIYTYKYKWIIGYLNNKPIAYAENTKVLFDWLKQNFPEYKDNTASHITRNLAKGIPYHGVLYKCVPEDEYQDIIKDINLDDFKDKIKAKLTVRQMPKSVPTPKPKPIKVQPKVEEPEMPKLKSEVVHKTSKLDDIDDSEFYKEQERKKQQFMEEMKRRLGGFHE